jgi:hypothetical protein
MPAHASHNQKLKYDKKWLKFRSLTASSLHQIMNNDWHSLFAFFPELIPPIPRPLADSLITVVAAGVGGTLGIVFLLVILVCCFSHRRNKRLIEEYKALRYLRKGEDYKVVFRDNSTNIRLLRFFKFRISSKFVKYWKKCHSHFNVISWNEILSGY